MRNAGTKEHLRRCRLLTFLKDRKGSSLVECAVVLPVLLLLMVGSIDFGRAYFISIQVASAAQAGAAYGVQSFTDTAGMITAAKLNAPSVPSMTTVATFGCECHDGSSSSALCTSNPTCPQNVLNYADVTTTAVYTPMLPYPGIPAAINLRSEVRMRVSQ
jgi:Flp pilus assembly protein TadG